MFISLERIFNHKQWILPYVYYKETKLINKIVKLTICSKSYYNFLLYLFLFLLKLKKRKHKLPKRLLTTDRATSAMRDRPGVAFFQPITIISKALEWTTLNAFTYFTPRIVQCLRWYRCLESFSNHVDCIVCFTNTWRRDGRKFCKKKVQAAASRSAWMDAHDYSCPAGRKTLKSQGLAFISIVVVATVYAN